MDTTLPASSSLDDQSNTLRVEETSRPSNLRATLVDEHSPVDRSQMDTDNTQNSMLKYFDNPVIFEAVHSYLPLKDLVTATRVCRTFNTSIFHPRGPLAARRTLHLQPDTTKPETWYVISQFSTRDATSAPCFQLTPTARSHERAIAGRWVKPVQPLHLCPVLELDIPDHWPHKHAAFRAFQRQGHEYARLKADPEKLGPWRDMVLTNPPRREAEITLVYKQEADCTVLATTTRIVSRAHALTLGELLDSAFRDAGDVCVYLYGAREQAAQATRGSLWEYSSFLGPCETSLEGKVAELEGRFGGRFVLDLERTEIVLCDAAVPVLWEWGMMEGKWRREARKEADRVAVEAHVARMVARLAAMRDGGL